MMYPYLNPGLTHKIAQRHEKAYICDECPVGPQMLENTPPPYENIKGHPSLVSLILLFLSRGWLLAWGTPGFS